MVMVIEIITIIMVVILVVIMAKIIVIVMALVLLRVTKQEFAMAARKGWRDGVRVEGVGRTRKQGQQQVGG